MHKKVLLPLFLIFLLSGCDYFIYKKLHKEGEGVRPVPPNIEESWASDRAKPGDVWKVYLIATDLDGDMKAIHSVIEQKGVGIHPVSITPIKPEYQKELSGYIYLNTDGMAGSETTAGSASLTLKVKIQDRAGNFSNEVAFPLSLDTRFKQIPSQPGYFKENDLGPIMARMPNPAKDRR